jgi:hypothetical protein
MKAVILLILVAVAVAAPQPQERFILDTFQDLWHKLQDIINAAKNEFNHLVQQAGHASTNLIFFLELICIALATKPANLACCHPRD